MRHHRIHGDGCFQPIIWYDDQETEEEALKRHLDSGQCEQKTYHRQ